MRVGLIHGIHLYLISRKLDSTNILEKEVLLFNFRFKFMLVEIVYICLQKFLDLKIGI